MNHPISKKLSKIIEVDSQKCVNCHACISVCPVKYCNDGSGDHVSVNPDLCIGCGNCIDACQHEARFGVDDSEQFFSELQRGIKYIAFIAPSAAANFPHQYLKVNGWLQSLGVTAFFDVSFGAELTVKSYLEYIKKANPQCVIAQPCPALVSYIQIYQPELLPYLAPADSPIIHAIKMVRRFYKEYHNHKAVVISPCYAKRREFDEVMPDVMNVTYQSIDRYLRENRIALSKYSDVDYSNPPAERAVLFSTPGGLLRTAQREFPQIIEKTRKIEGAHIIYRYLSQLYKMIQQGKAPLLVDCLNCEMGCNGGTGTLTKGKSLDEVESLIEERNQEMQQKYKNIKQLNKTINDYWDPKFYHRSYLNLSDNNTVETPSETKKTEIFHKMQKYTKKDVHNCRACGYNECDKMATAIYNGLNKPENCHHALELDKEQSHRSMLHHQQKNLQAFSLFIENFQSRVNQLIEKIKLTEGTTKRFAPIIQSINDISYTVKMISLNASIEAARAGEVGSGFAVVAKEVGELSRRSKEETLKIEPFAKDIQECLRLIQSEVKSLTEEMANQSKLLLNTLEEKN